MPRRSPVGRVEHLRRPVIRDLLLVCLACCLSAVGLLSATGCAGGSPDQRVSPLRDDTTHAGDPTTRSDTDRADGPRRASGAGSGDDLSEDGASDEETSEGRHAEQEVAELLERFDAALTALYANPTAAGDDEHPLSVAWLDVVVGGSQLDRQVRGRILASGTQDGMRIVPDANGTSFTNVALELAEEPDGSLTWTNCGYAPGVGVDLDTGEILDDNRTSTRGRGRAVRGPDGELSVSELWDDETVLLAAEDPDPCAALADRPTGGKR